MLAWAAVRLLAGRPRALQVRLELVLLAVSAVAAFAVRHVVVHEGWMRTFPNTLIGKWPWFAVGLALAVIRAAWGASPAASARRSSGASRRIRGPGGRPPGRSCCSPRSAACCPGTCS